VKRKETEATPTIYASLTSQHASDHCLVISFSIVNQVRLYTLLFTCLWYLERLGKLVVQPETHTRCSLFCWQISTYDLCSFLYI